jgi:DNA-binding IclR family transcriptional regulator
MPDDDADAYISPPVQRAARLLRSIAGGDAVTNMARTARALDISRTTLLRLLRTLEAERFIAPRPGEGAGWQIGGGLLALTTQAFAAQDLVQVAVPILTPLAETLGLSAHLGVLEEREVVYLIRRTPNLAFVSNIRVGSRLPAHAANMGRIILAHLPVTQVEQLFANVSLKPATAKTPTTLPGLLTLLAEDRAAGLAWSEGNFEPAIASVAAAVRDASGVPVAAINVSGPLSSFTGAERRTRIGLAVKEAARAISLHLGWNGVDQNLDSAA